MTRFMLLQYYAAPDGVRPMSEWTPAEIRAHIDFQTALNAELTESGELVDAQGLAGPELARNVFHDGTGSPVITDGPFPESKELLAGYRIIDVESPDRALQIAARSSAVPEQEGRLMAIQIEVREIMGAPTFDD